MGITKYETLRADELKAVSDEASSLSPDALLLPLAEAMGDLICHADFEQVKICEGPTCTLWFNDVSKNHTRRWCSMAVCGNRAKAAAHRAKNRSA